MTLISDLASSIRKDMQLESQISVVNASTESDVSKEEYDVAFPISTSQTSVQHSVIDRNASKLELLPKCPPFDYVHGDFRNVSLTEIGTNDVQRHQDCYDGLKLVESSIGDYQRNHPESGFVFFILINADRACHYF